MARSFLEHVVKPIYSCVFSETFADVELDGRHVVTAGDIRYLSNAHAHSAVVLCFDCRGRLTGYLTFILYTS